MPQSKSCVEFKILKDKNLELTKSLQNFTNNKSRLELILENQQNLNNKKGLILIKEETIRKD